MSAWILPFMLEENGGQIRYPWGWAHLYSSYMYHNNKENGSIYVALHNCEVKLAVLLGAEIKVLTNDIPVRREAAERSKKDRKQMLCYWKSTSIRGHPEGVSSLQTGWGTAETDLCPYAGAALSHWHKSCSNDIYKFSRWNMNKDKNSIIKSYASLLHRDVCQE